MRSVTGHQLSAEEQLLLLPGDARTFVYHAVTDVKKVAELRDFASKIKVSAPGIDGLEDIGMHRRQAFCKSLTFKHRFRWFKGWGRYILQATGRSREWRGRRVTGARFIRVSMTSTIGVGVH